MSIIEGRNAEILQSIIDGTQYENPNPYPSRIEQLLMELKEVIEQGGSGTVDQTYTPTSENAQSGKAVAEALETIPTVTVDQTYDAQSANAQSGTAIAQALAAIPSATVDQIFDYQSVNPQSGAAFEYAVIKNVSENTTSLTISNTAMSTSGNVNVFGDYPVGTLFLVSIKANSSSATYKTGSAIVALSGTDATNTAWNYVASVIMVNGSFTGTMTDIKVGIVKDSGNFVKIKALASNSNLAGDYSFRVQRLSITGRTNTL